MYGVSFVHIKMCINNRHTSNKASITRWWLSWLYICCCFDFFSALKYIYIYIYIYIYSHILYDCSLEIWLKTEFLKITTWFSFYNHIPKAHCQTSLSKIFIIFDYIYIYIYIYIYACIKIYENIYVVIHTYTV